MYWDKHCCALTERGVLEGVAVCTESTRMLRKMTFAIKNNNTMMRRQSNKMMRVL